MDIVRNFPAISILLCMFAAIISSGLTRKVAKTISYILIAVVFVLSAFSLAYCLGLGEPVVYVMGKFPAPWGNEIRFGVLECFLSMFFSVIMLLSLVGGQHKIPQEIAEDKQFLYYVLIDLLFSSILALVYTNDIFTAYVFVEINTIAAAGLIVIRANGRTIMSAVRYMIMSLLGSGLLLLGICTLYDLTGHLLMSNIKEAVLMIVAEGTYHEPLLISIAFISVGLAIKSALFPFHSWLPDAYGYSTVSSAAILSSLVSKGYIVLLLKIIFRVVGFEAFCDSHIVNILFLFGLCGMIFGSVSAIRENDIRRMIAFSSVAQIGYIYMGIGLGTEIGITASIFHILSHAATKSLLFIAAIGLTDVSDGSRQFLKLTGSGYRNVAAGITFTVGALSMVGVPLFSGFISKLLFAQAATLNVGKMLPTLICLGISTILNAIYFMKTVVRIYTPIDEATFAATNCSIVKAKNQVPYVITCIFFILLNVVLGVYSDPAVNLITRGIHMFG